MRSAPRRRILCVLLAAVSGLVLAATRVEAQEHPTTGSAQYPSLRISGFGDVTFSRTTNDADVKGFTLGQLALHMISELS